MKDKFECYILLGLSCFTLIYSVFVGDYVCSFLSLFVFIVWVLILYKC